MRYSRPICSKTGIVINSYFQKPGKYFSKGNDLSHFYSAPGLQETAVLKIKNKLDLLDDTNMLLMVKKVYKVKFVT